MDCGEAQRDYSILKQRAKIVSPGVPRLADVSRHGREDLLTNPGVVEHDEIPRALGMTLFAHAALGVGGRPRDDGTRRQDHNAR